MSKSVYTLLYCTIKTAVGLLIFFGTPHTYVGPVEMRHHITGSLRRVKCLKYMYENKITVPSGSLRVISELGATQM